MFFCVLLVGLLLQLDMIQTSPTSKVLPHQSEYSYICEGDTWRFQNDFIRGFKRTAKAAQVEKNGDSIIYKHWGHNITINDQRASFHWKQEDKLIFQYENITSSDEGVYHIKVFIVGGSNSEDDTTNLTVINAADCSKWKNMGKPTISYQTKSSSIITINKGQVNISEPGEITLLTINIPGTDPPIDCEVATEGFVYSCTGTAGKDSLCKVNVSDWDISSQLVNVTWKFATFKPITALVQFNIPDVPELQVLTVSPTEFNTVFTSASATISSTVDSGDKTTIVIVISVVLAIAVLIASAILLVYYLRHKGKRPHEVPNNVHKGEILVTKDSTFDQHPLKTEPGKEEVEVLNETTTLIHNFDETDSTNREPEASVKKPSGKNIEKQTCSKNDTTSLTAEVSDSLPEGANNTTKEIK